MSKTYRELLEDNNKLQADNEKILKEYQNLHSKYKALLKQANQFIDFFQNFNNPKQS